MDGATGCKKETSTHIHGIPTSGLLTGVALGQGPVERVSQRILSQVGQNLIIDLESRKIFRRGDSFLGKRLDGDGFVALCVDEFVIHDFDTAILCGQLSEAVGDRLGVGEGGHVLANAGKAESHVLRVGPTELPFAFLSDDGEVKIWVLFQDSSGRSRHAGVDGTTEAFVGARNHQQGLLIFYWFCLGFVKDLL